MTSQKPLLFPTVFFLLTLITVGLISAARAEALPEHGAQTATAKANTFEADSRAKESRDYASELSARSPLGHFEPLLLLLLGTLLLSVVTGVNFVRSRRLQLRSVGPTAADAAEEFRARGATGKTL